MGKMNNILNHFEEYIGVLSLILTSFIVFVQVVLRYVFNYSLHWSEEVARYLIIWFIFIGSSIAVREKAHAAVDVLVVYLPSYLKKVFSLLANFVGILFCLILIVSGYETVLNVIKFGNVTPSLGLPMYIPYLALPVGGFLMMIRFLQLFISDIKSFRNPNGLSDERNEEVAKR
ncbi:TRAP transporter small permease [Pueribacillus theae]|uniref:TRAP transporter small permease n=2 Tax=Pueribacillus theae TaxID=2171751 RepID=A0A2U1K2S6_9BACI|nr:TRAP transporter small permease [Pueribacillus theae]